MISGWKMLPLAQVLVFLLLCLELPLASPVGIDFIYLNYCDPKLCPNGGKHVACKATENRLGKKCSLDAEIMPIDGKQQDILVNRINEMRDKVARGGFSGLTAAAKMATMSWDPELAYLAGFNVQECSPHFDECRNTLQYSNVGQSVAYRGLLSKHRGMPEILDNAIGLWFREHEVTTMDDILNYIGPHFGKPRENFVQMVVDNCNRVGCAVVQQSKNGWLQTYLTCNYAFAPQLGQPIYNSSKVPGAECQSGHNPTFKNLCSVSEVFVRNVIPPPVDAQQLMRLLPGGEPPAAEETEPDSESSSYDESEMEPFHPGPHDFEPLKQPKYKRRPKGQKQWGLNLNPWGGIDKTTATPKEVTTAAPGGITTAAAAAGGEKITLAAGGKETTAAAGKETTVGAGGTHTTVAAGGKEITAAPGGKEITAAAGGVSTELPGGITTAAAGGEMTTADAGGQDTTAAAGGEQTTVAEGGAETTAAAGGKETTAAAAEGAETTEGGKETTAAAAGGETEAPAARRRSVKRRSPPLRQRTKVQPKKAKARTNKEHKSGPKTRTAKRRRSKIQRRDGDGETTVAAEGATPVGEAGAADGGATTAAGGEANTEGGGTTAAEGEANTEGGGTTAAGGEVGGVTTAAGEPTSGAGATTVAGGEPTAVEGATAEGEGATTVAGETNAAGGELTTVAGAGTVGGATTVGGVELTTVEGVTSSGGATTVAGDIPVAGATTVAGAATVAGGATTLGGGELITVAGAITPGVGGLSIVLGVTTVGGGVATVGGAQGASTPLPDLANVQQQIPPLPGGQPPPENEKKPTAVTEKDNIDDSYALEEMEDEVKAEEKMEKEKANDGQAIEDRAAIQRKFARFLAMVRKAKVLNKRGKVMIVTTNHEVEYNSRKVQERSARRRAARRLQKRTRAVDRARRMRRSRSRRHRGKRAMRRSYQNQPRKNQPRSRRLRRQHAKTRAKGDARWNVVG